MQTPNEADALLLAGLYAPLSEKEKLDIFSGIDPTEADAVAYPSPSDVLRSVQDTISEITRSFDRRTVGDPQPRWARELLALVGWPVDHLSSEDVLLAIFWIFVWGLGWALTFRLMSWPFSDPADVRIAVIQYAIGSILIPVLTTIPIFMKEQTFWQRQKNLDRRLLWLYTLQGAIVGFQVGYMSIFFVALFIYQVGIYPYLRWLGVLLALLPVILGYAAAREVPFNLWRVYKRLSLKDGGIFFIFALLGPVWSLFFLAIYPVLLAPGYGLAILLVAISILALLKTWQKRRKCLD